MKKLLLILLALNVTLFSEGFLKRDGRKIVDANKNEILLRGIGLGGWLLPEGYMLNTSAFANSPKEIRRKIVEVIGESNTVEFFNAYRKNFVREIDIKKIADWGFNSIRLPMHYEHLCSGTEVGKFYEEGFSTIDSLISWCKKYNIYLILDLHAAPGGQSDEPISDWEQGVPSLWESQLNKDITKALWFEIASRYKNETTIAGYDLLNEPKWQLGGNNEQLRSFFIELTNEVRKVDTNHIVFIEGNWFATDFKGLSPKWDENMAYSFHKYWNTPDQGSIQYLVDLSKREDVPLWCGESGENSNHWNAECIKLLEDNNIGWSWWTYKKFETVSGPLSVNQTKGYNDLLKYWKNEGPKPDQTTAYNSLMQMTENLKLEYCTERKDYIDALFRLPYDNTTKPFKEIEIPGFVFAVDYDMGKQMHAYNDEVYWNVGGTNWNNGWVYRNDGVDIEACKDFPSVGYNVGWIGNGEWLKYTVNILQEGDYDINIRYAATETKGYIAIQYDNIDVVKYTQLNGTGGWQSWRTKEFKGIHLDAGIHTFTVKSLLGGFNVNYLEFVHNPTDVKEEETPKEFKLKKNYPNPFNPTTTISYSLDRRRNVKLEIYNSNGELVDKLFNGVQSAGNYEFVWKANGIASGVYFINLKADNLNQIRKTVLLK